LTDIDTSDCDTAITSLRSLAQKLLLDKDSGDDKSNSAPNWTQAGNTSPIDGSRERTESTSEEGEVILSTAEFGKHALDSNEDGSMENMRKVSASAMEADASDGSEKNVDKSDSDGGGHCKTNLDDEL